MNYIVEDSELAKRNKSLVMGCGGSSAYNAVLGVVFSDESDTEPVTRDEAKNWCRIDVTDDDNLIDALITAARIVCENYANLSFIERTVTATIHNGLGNFTLPYGPAVDSVTITDLDDNDITDYELTDAHDDDLVVEYEAGYEILPGNLKTALLCQIAFMYENRSAAEMSPIAKSFLKQVRYV